MARLGSWIESPPRGVSTCARRTRGSIRRSPKPRALITHGHSDHARGGHGAVLATAETLAIMAVRCGDRRRPGRSLMARPIRVGDVDVTLRARRPCARLGADRARASGERIVVSGDYKRRADPTCPPFVPVPCDIFITEATFGLPVFRHPDTGSEIDRLLHALHADPGARCIWSAPMRWARRSAIIRMLRDAGYHEPIYLHGAMERLCRLYDEVRRRPRRAQRPPPARDARTELGGADRDRPARALNDRWARRLPDPVTAMASGWMRIRQRARQRNVELPLILSDHADWDELTMTIRELEPTRSLDHPWPRGSAQALVPDPPDQGVRAEPGRLRG